MAHAMPLPRYSGEDSFADLVLDLRVSLHLAFSPLFVFSMDSMLLPDSVSFGAIS